MGKRYFNPWLVVLLAIVLYCTLLVSMAWADDSVAGELLGAVGTAVSGIANVATGGILGSLFGVLGSAIGVWQKNKERKADQEFQKEKWDYELKLIDKQREARREETESEIALAASAGSWGGLSASVAADAEYGKEDGFAGTVRKLFRPLLTTMLLVATIWLFYALLNMEKDLVRFLGTTAVADLIKYIVYSVVFSCACSITWWFGDRAFRPRAYK